MKAFLVTILGDGPKQKKELLIGTEPTSSAARERALRMFGEPWIPTRVVVEDIR
jgi:hypothetical protein